MPSEEEVRSLVERIVDGVVVTDTQTPEVAAPRGDPPPSSPDILGRIAIGADHGGYPLKERIAFRLKEAGWDVVDCGTHSQESVDYPEYALAVAQKVAGGECRWGIMIDGAGIGSSMVANKVPGVRAALCYDVSSARNSREHNHSNVLTLGAGLIGDGLASQIVEEWLSTEWSGGRHARRVAMIDALDQQYSRPE
ncbi:MAG: ribose 5-phosphate isomerase B [Acidimicrobiia bacterium]